jgi:hypothetical protein
MYQRPGSAVCWLGKWPLKARVFLLLSSGSEILIYNGSESLDRVKDKFDMYTTTNEILEAKISEKVVGRCVLTMEDGGAVSFIYKQRKAYHVRH